MDRQKEVKLIVVGETNVGKTSLIKQYIDHTFVEEKTATIGYDTIQKELEINGKSIRLNIWDTCGQEQYRTINQMFVKNSKMALLVYDITDRETFEELKKYWYQYIKSALEEELIIGVAGNKCDLYEEEQVKIEEGKEYAQSIGAVFKETTAKNDEAITELIELMAKKYLDNIASKVDDVKDNKNIDKNNKSGNLKLNNNQTKPNKKGCC